MAEHDGIFDWIKKKNGIGPVSLRSFFSYFTADDSDVNLSALPDNNSLVTKGMLLVVANSIPETTPPIPTTITAGTTPVSLTVVYTDFVYPTVLFRDPSGNNYTGFINYQDTGASIILTSPDDGTGHSVDSYVMIIKA